MAAPTPTPPAPRAADAAPKPPRNPALRMLGLPGLPRKLPSRNWMIFWTVSTAIAAAIIYDKREKKRAIAKWSHSVEHLAKEPLPDSLGLAQPRKLTIYLSSPPGDGLRAAQDHYTEYVKPILAASGLDWEFVQGRREGDVRAYIAERVRRLRCSRGENGQPDPNKEPTKEEIVDAFRKARGIHDYDGVRGDVVIGRHTWKEYIRGLHEGWLGPLAPPSEPEPLPAATATESPSQDKPAEEEKAAEAEKKPKKPPQPRPYNTTAHYPTSTLPQLTPDEFSPSAPIREPHLLGFLNTPTRLYRFFNRRKLADDIGRETAAVCLCTYRHFRQPAPEPDAAGPTKSRDGELPTYEFRPYIVQIPDQQQQQQLAPQPTKSGGDELSPYVRDVRGVSTPQTPYPRRQRQQYEQQEELEWEEKDWIKAVWKEDDASGADAAAETPEKIWAKPIVMDPRVAGRMRRFQLTPEDEERASKVVVLEEEVEGWIKGKLRQLCRWGAQKAFEKKTKAGPLDGKDSDVD